MIEQLPDLPENVIGFRAVGTVDASDYEAVIGPAIDATIANANKAMANLTEASNNLRPTLQQVDLTVRKYGMVADNAATVVPTAVIGTARLL